MACSPPVPPGSVLARASCDVRWRLCRQIDCERFRDAATSKPLANFQPGCFRPASINQTPGAATPDQPAACLWWRTRAGNLSAHERGFECLAESPARAGIMVYDMFDKCQVEGARTAGRRRYLVQVVARTSVVHGLFPTCGPEMPHS